MCSSFRTRTATASERLAALVVVPLLGREEILATLATRLDPGFLPIHISDRRLCHSMAWASGSRLALAIDFLDRLKVTPPYG